jgi:hypothetical protein
MSISQKLVVNNIISDPFSQGDTEISFPFTGPFAMTCTMKCRIDNQFCEVTLHGQETTASAAAVAVSSDALPVGYRPSAARQTQILGQNNAATSSLFVSIATTGIITITPVGATTFTDSASCGWLDVSFRFEL